MLKIGAYPISVISVYTLTASKTGNGTITSSPAGINYGTDDAENYNSGTAVTLTASPASGSVFDGWSGACTGTNTCTVTMSGNKTVSATFNIQSTVDCLNTNILCVDDDGNKEYSTIQAAINALSADNQQIWIYPGDYYESVTADYPQGQSKK